MSAGDAAATYAILSVGDGLIAQIPALLISIAAGIIVTRVPGENRRNLASELTEQILRQRQALWIVAAVLALFAALPGFPTLIFLSLGAGLAAIAYSLRRKEQQHSPHTASHSAASRDEWAGGRTTAYRRNTARTAPARRAGPRSLPHPGAGHTAGRKAGAGGAAVTGDSDPDR